MKYKDIKEAKMGVNFTPSARPVYNIDDGTEFVAKKNFKIENGSAFSSNPSFSFEVKKGDTVLNLPGGIFWLPTQTSRIPKIAGYQTPLRGKKAIHITRNKENIGRILKNVKQIA